MQYMCWRPEIFEIVCLLFQIVFQKFSVSNLAETFYTSPKYKIIQVAKISARLEKSNFQKILFTPLNQNFQKFNVSNLAETFHK